MGSMAICAGSAIMYTQHLFLFSFSWFIYIKDACLLYQFSQTRNIVMKLTERKIRYIPKSKRSMTAPKCTHSSTLSSVLKCLSTCRRMDSNSCLIFLSSWRVGFVLWAASLRGVSTTGSQHLVSVRRSTDTREVVEIFYT